MKKQLRLVLFAVLVMLLVMTMALAASAEATEGATTAEEGHYYSAVSSEENATPKYYTTLAAAVASIDADGYTITVLADVSDAAWVLDSSYTYTITGGTEGKTVTFTSHDSAKQSLIHISAGNVTISNLSVVRGEAITDTTAAVVYVSSACTLTLENVVTSAAVTDTLYVNAVATVNISGANTDLSGAIGNIVDLRANATVNITGGKLTGTGGTGGGPVFYVPRNKAPVVQITNATVVSGEGKAILAGANHKASVTLGTGASIVGNNGTMFGNFIAGSTLEINGASIYLSGGALLHPNSAPKATITSVSGTIYLQNGAAMPSEILDKVGTGEGFEWSKLTLKTVGIIGPCELTEGEYTIASVQQATQLAKERFVAKYAERFPNLEIDGDNLVAFVLNGDGVVLNVTAGEYALAEGFFIQVKKGTLNISGGTFNGAEGGTVLDVEGGTTNLIGGTLTGAVGSNVLDVKGGAVYLSGATLAGGAEGTVGLITGGTVYYVSGTYLAGEQGKAFDERGGTFCVDGAKMQLEQHRYTLLAPGENAEPLYYVTLQAAVAAIDADGYAITLLANTTEAGCTLNASFTYTVTGATDGLTVTFNAANAGNASFINISVGNVTFRNIAFARDEQLEGTVAAFVRVSGEATLALQDVTVNVAVTDNLYIGASATVTVSGQTAISGFTGSFINVRASDVSVNISGGTVAGVKMFSVLEAQNVEIRVTGAELSVSDNLLYTDDAAVTLRLLEDATVRATNAVLFACTDREATVELNGATVYLAGEDTMLCEAGSDLIDVVATDGTLYLDKDVPELITFLGTTADEDWSGIVFYLSNVPLTFELDTECNLTITSLDQFLELMMVQVRASFQAQYATLFPLAQLALPAGYESSIGLIINHADATVALSGTFTVNSGALVTLKAGTLNIVGGTYVVGGDACLIDHQGGTLNITGGSFSGTAGTDSYLIYTNGAAGTIRISGGTFKIFTVVYACSEVEITVSNGQFGAVAEGAGSNAFRISHADASLSITGGTFADMSRGIWAQSGEISISGGRFFTMNGENAQHITVNGAVTVNITGNPEFQLLFDASTQRCIYVDTNSDQATVNISGGRFGDLQQTLENVYCFFASSKIDSLNITGGTFFGGASSGGALMIGNAATGSSVNISGTAAFYAYINVYVASATTVNVSGGSFNPHPGSAQNVMFKLSDTSTGSELTVSGGTFNKFMTVFEVASVSTVTVSGGTYNERTACAADTDMIEAFAYITAAATFNVQEGENGAKPVINLGYSTQVSGGTAYSYKGVAFKIVENADATLSISGGTFTTRLAENLIFDVMVGSVRSLSITGGTFHVLGEGADFLPRSVFDVADNGCVLSGATLYIGKGAYLPIYNHIDAYGLKLTVTGKYYVQNRLMVRTPFAGSDPDGKGFVISNMTDIETMLKAQFADFVVEGEINCASQYIPFTIDDAAVVVTLENFIDSYNIRSLVQVVSGTLKVNGGAYNAQAGEKLFEILGDATLTITGGLFNVKGTGSYMIYIAEGVSTDNVSVSGAVIEVAEFGNVPLYATFNVSAERLTVYGMSEILLNEAKTYTVSDYETFSRAIEESLIEKFSIADNDIKVEIRAWVPLRVDNEDAKLVFTGGEYNSSMDYMFAMVAGQLELKGGKFTNDAGDIIRVLGPNVKITIDLPDDAQNGIYTAGSIVSAIDVENVDITVAGGRLAELACDTEENLKKALFVLDTTDAVTSATLTISGGSFTATRVLYVGNNVNATATISDGVFVSNQTSATSRLESAHMFVLNGADARLYISGGSFDNKQGNYIVAQLTVDGSATVISGGAFNGGCGWFYTDAATALTIDANTDPQKNPVFNDTDVTGIASCGYIYLNNANASVIVNAGTFTYGNSHEPIFRVQAGRLTVNGGTAKGYLFYVTLNSDITVNAGNYTASGAGATLVNLVGNITETQFDITAAITVGVENNASFFETALSKKKVLDLLSDVKYTVNGNARLSKSITLTGHETWNTLEDAQHLITGFFGADKVAFESVGTYSLSLSGNYTITINGGARSFYDATLLSLSGGADLVINGGTFTVEGGHIFHVSGAGSTITIGNANDPSVKPEFTVNGGSVIYNDKVGSTVVIHNGSFVHGVYEGETLKPVINASEPLFYFGESTQKSSIIIHDGYYEATSILSDAKDSTNQDAVGTNTTIHNGTFKSNYIAANMSQENEKVTDKIDYAPYSLFYFNGKDRALTVSGGSFDGGLGYAIFGLYGLGGNNTWTIEGGTFDGGYFWIRLDKAAALTIKNQVDGEDNVIAKPTFTDGDGYTCQGIYFAASSTLNINGGKFTMKDADGHSGMFLFNGTNTVNITDGEFGIHLNNRFDGTALKNASVMFALAGTKITLNISGGSFTAARIIYDSKGSNEIEISNGRFVSNAITASNANMIQISAKSTVLTIKDGYFEGNARTQYILYFTGSGGITANILSGTFKMGVCWINSAHVGLVLNIGEQGKKGPTFEGLSDGTAAGLTSRGVYLSKAGQTLNAYSGTFKLASDQSFAVFYRVYAEMTFYEDIEVTAPNSIFSISGGSGKLHIRGGKYTCDDVGQMFYVSATPEEPCNILIEGGDFVSDGLSDMFNMGSSSNIVFRITGGNFFSSDVRLFFVLDSSTQIIIEGGNFSTTAPYMIHIESNTVPFVIRGGTFTMLEKDGINSDDALIYIAGREPSVINIEGGDFFDERSNGKQMIFKYNPKAVINMSGNFKMYSIEQKDYFFYDYDDFTNSLIMADYMPQERRNGKDYYTCFGYYNAYAPVITKTPMLFAQLGGEGITYTASVSAEVAQYLATLGTVSYGTLIFPTEFLANGWENGTDFLEELKAYAENEGKPYSSVYTIVNAVNGLVTEEDGSLTIRAALVNIKEKNHSRNFTGIAFAKVTAANGEETYYYASHVSVGVTTDMCSIAKAALTDLQSKPTQKNDRVYCYASILQRNKFSRYTTVFQDSLRKYLPEKDRKPKF